VAKAILVEKEDDEIALSVLALLMAPVGAARGSVLVREGGAWREVIHAGDLPRRVDARRRNALVAEAFATRSVVRSEDDGAIALAAPFVDGEGAAAVVHLEGLPGAFPKGSTEFLRGACALAASAIRRFIEVRHRASSEAAPSELFPGHDFDGIITRHPRMIEAVGLIAKAAPTRAPVLILGPTGSGKELLAHALHRNSDRRAGAFVPVHCSAIPASLLESELFGHVAGAFSGAKRDRPGRIATARAGTLFLDEMGEIPLDFQIKLLRFLECGEIQRVGDDRSETVDARIVSATHQNLRDLVATGRFREDLYYRLNVITVHIPPLRERGSDIPLLIEHFLARFGGSRGFRLTPEAEELLLDYPYPGNVRELAHIIERACILCADETIDVDLLPTEVTERPRSPSAGDDVPTSASLERARAEAVASAERVFLRRLMTRARGNVSRAAREAGMHRSYLQKLLARHRHSLDH
jgi:DNA-binding NtrC family response regulator